MKAPKVIAALAALALSVSPLSAETLNWLTHKSKASSEAHVLSLQWFADELEKRTDGEYKIRFHWSGSMAGSSEVPSALQNRVGEIGDMITVYFPDQFPLNNAVSFFLPQPQNVNDTGALVEKWSREYPEFEAELAQYNLKMLGVRPMEPNGLLCSKPIRTLSDFEGVRIRSYGFTVPAMIQALGAIPIPMGSAETYEALERNIIDCTLTGPALAKGWKWTEVAKYYIDVPVGVAWGQQIIINQDAFDEMPPHVQQVMQDLGKEYLGNYAETLMSQLNEILDEWRADPDMEVIAFDADEFLGAFQGAAEMEDIQNSWIERANALGVPGQKIADELMGNDL